MAVLGKMSSADAELEGFTSPVNMSASRLKQINDHVFEVCTPAGGRPSMELVFFHGLQEGEYKEAHVRTWMSRDMSEMWLGWLQDVFPGARIVTVSYGSLSWRTSEMHYPLAVNSGDIYPMAEVLLRSIVRAGIGQRPGCPVLMVGHSFGGQVMKGMCVVADMLLWKHGSQLRANECFKFLQNLKGLFFFSTPHAGSNLPEAIMERTPFPPKDVRPSWSNLNLHNNFRERVIRYKWRTSGVCESRVTTLDDFLGLIIPVDSSRIELHEHGHHLLDGVDHFDVCRPHDRMSDSFLALTGFIGTVLDDLKEEESRGGRRDLTTAEETGDVNAFRWYEDPVTWDKMCDPVKCSDGRTYNRWTILDKKMSRSPYDRNLTTFGILCDDIDARSRLFRVFPEQELEFRERRKMYREEALQHARADPIEFEDAQEKLSNVVKWMPHDHECQTELDAIQFLVSHLPKSKVLSRSPPPPEQSHISRTPVTIREIRDSGIPDLMHEDFTRGRTSSNIEGYRLVVFLVLFYMLFWFFIT